jgi:hypothetical protein
MGTCNGAAVLLGMIGCVENWRPIVRPTVSSSAYTVVVMATAAVGFVADSTRTILIAALLGLPASIIAVPGYYVVYGVLALVPGANPSSSAGSGSCTPAGSCHESVTGELATWFTITTDAVGILALTAAALLNVIVFRMLTARRRGVSGVTSPGH